MSVSIRTNVVSRMLAGELNRTQTDLNRSSNRLASGDRLSRVGTDSSGAAVATNLRTRATGLRQAIRNANDGLSLLQTNEASAQSFTDTLGRMRELATQSASQTLHDDERSHLSDEFENHVAEMRRLVFSTTFNDAVLSSGVIRAVQVGADGDSDSQIEISGANLKSTQILVRTSEIAEAELALRAIQDIDRALEFLNSERANLGSEMNRLQAAIHTATASHEGLNAARGRIEDTDMAVETAQMTALQIKHRAGVAAIAQAGNLARPVLDLI